jgi:acetyl esterase/lipase
MSTLLHWLRPTYDAIFSRLPFPYRWRLLCLQPLALLTYALKSLPYFFYPAPFKVHHLPSRTRNRLIRTIIFHQPRLPTATNQLRPLHLDIHGGGFLGGIAEYDVPFCKRVADETGAVVVSTQYRCAPVHTFPAAHEDVEDVVSWLRENAADVLGANPELLTVSGFSAGANLALGVSQMEGLCAPASTAVKASVTFYAPVSWSAICKFASGVEFSLEYLEIFVDEFLVLL